MNRTEEPSQFTPQLMAELQAAIERAMKGIRDPDAMQKARDRMDQTRDEIFHRHGLLRCAKGGCLGIPFLERSVPEWGAGAQFSTTRLASSYPPGRSIASAHSCAR